MRKLLLISCILLIATTAWAKREVYDPDTNQHITLGDSDTRTLAQLKTDYGLSANAQEFILTDTEAIRDNAGTMEKFDYVADVAAKKAAEATDRSNKEAAMKSKLGLTDQEWSDLKTALGLK